jgi:hypothetical protein
MTRWCLPVDQWPEIDRAGWHLAQKPPGFLEGDKPASHWSAASKDKVAQAYGRWLGFLERTGRSTRPAPPGSDSPRPGSGHSSSNSRAASPP